MRHFAAVLCRDAATRQVLEQALEELRIGLISCPSGKDALELIMQGRCSTLIVDFDLPDADEVIRMAALLPATQKPNLLAVASRVWPGTGEAFQSGAGRILYRPLDPELLKDALRAAKKTPFKTRKSTRYEMKTLVYLELESGTLPAISIDIGEHGLALQATEPVPMNSHLKFRCQLPGTDFTLRGYVDVIWASDQGRAGVFFSELAPTARKHLQQWLSRRSARSKEKHAVRDLLPPADEHVSFVASE